MDPLNKKNNRPGADHGGSSSTLNSENLHKANLTFTQLLRRSLLENVLLISTIAAVFSGVAIGFIMRKSAPSDGYSQEFITLVSFPGDMFLRMLKVLILPLIIASVISALASLDSTVSGKIGVRSCLFYMATTIIATITGIILVTLIHPGDTQMKQGFEQAGEYCDYMIVFVICNCKLYFVIS